MIGLFVSENTLEITQRLDAIPPELREIVVEKFREAVTMVAGKYSGKLPSFKLKSGVEVQGSLVIGWFEPDEPKAMAREFGGKGFYPILPNKSRLLRFFGKRDGRLVYTSVVNHPPSREYRDLRNWVDEMLPALSEEIREALMQKL